MGMYGSGKRNSNGEHLLEFLVSKNMFACNTAFKHPVRHITTRIGYIKDYNAPRNSKKTRPYYSQIDFILCRCAYKKLLVNARSYGGTSVKSDHKLVIAKFDLKDAHLIYPKQKPNKRFHCSTLVSDSNACKLYNLDLIETLNKVPIDPNPNIEMNNIFDGICKAAENTIGYLPKQNHTNFSNDPEICNMAAEKKKLKNDLNHANSTADRSPLRTQINRLQNNIKSRFKTLHEEQADQLAKEINSTDNTRACFAATRLLAGIKKTKTITVHDSNKNFIGTDTGKASVLKTHFENKFTADKSVPP